MSILKSINYVFWLIWLINTALAAQTQCVDLVQLTNLGELHKTLQCLEAKIDQRPKVSVSSPDETVAGEAFIQRDYFGDIDVGLRYCKRYGTRVICKLTLTNEGQQKYTGAVKCGRNGTKFRYRKKTSRSRYDDYDHYPSRCIINKRTLSTNASVDAKIIFDLVSKTLKSFLHLKIFLEPPPTNNQGKDSVVFNGVPIR